MTWLFLLGGLASANESTWQTDCFTRQQGRACVQLGTTLWQTPARREEARKAFTKGCELKVESACTLKNLPIAATTRPGGITKKGPYTYSIPRARAVQSARDLQRTLSLAKLEKDPRGYRIVELQAGEVFDQIGLRVGDVISHVNGQAMESPAAATALIPHLVYEEEFFVDLIRGGKDVRYTYVLTD